MNDELFDVVIIGAGSAGCVLANRLSADPSNRVLLLEAGGPDHLWDLIVHMPAALGFPVGNRFDDWCFTSEPEPLMHGRRLAHPRGKLLGGSSSINAMVYQRGNPLDFDRWAADPGMGDWDYAHYLPYFRRLEARPERDRRVARPRRAPAPRARPRHQPAVPRVLRGRTPGRALSMLGGIAHLNMQNALLRFVPVAGPQAPRLVAGAYAAAIASAVIIGVLFALGAPIWAPDMVAVAGLGALVVFFAVGTPLMAMFDVEDNLLTGLGRAMVVPVENLLFALLKAGLLVLAAFVVIPGGIAVS